MLLSITLQGFIFQSWLLLILQFYSLKEVMSFQTFFLRNTRWRNFRNCTKPRGIFFLYLSTRRIWCYDCMWQSTMSSSMVPFFLCWNHKRAYRTLVLWWVATEGRPGVGLQWKQEGGTWKLNVFFKPILWNSVFVQILNYIFKLHLPTLNHLLLACRI